MKSRPKFFSNFIASLVFLGKTMQDSFQNSKIYKSVQLIKLKLIHLNDYFKTEDISKISNDVEKVTPYLFVVRWFLDTLLYGSLITLVLCTVFQVPFAPLLVLGTGILRWLVYDSISALKESIR